MSKPEECPRCGGPLERDEVDIGVGVQTGPAGCPSCFWTEGEDVGRIIPSALLAWARVQVRNLPLAKDDAIIITEVVNSGRVITPAVTLGNLKAWIKSEAETQQLLAQYEEQGRRLIEERDAIKAQLSELTELHAGPAKQEWAQASQDENLARDMRSTFASLKALSEGLTIISAAEPVDGEPRFRIDPKPTIEEMERAINNGIKLDIRADGSVVARSVADARATVADRFKKKPYEPPKLLPYAEVKAALDRDPALRAFSDAVGRYGSPPPGYPPGFIITPFTEEERVRADAAITGPLVVKQLTPFTRIPVGPLDMSTDKVIFDPKTLEVKSRIPWACCVECRGAYEVHDPKCSRYTPGAEE